MVKLLAICLFFSLFSNDLNAQVDRRIGQGQYKNDYTPPKKEEMVEKTLEIFKEKLNLDPFQEAVVKNLLKDNDAKSNEIIESNAYSNIEKNNMLNDLAEKFSVEIQKVLNPQQKEAYLVMIKKKKK